MRDRANRVNKSVSKTYRPPDEYFFLADLSRGPVQSGPDGGSAVPVKEDRPVAAVVSG